MSSAYGYDSYGAAPLLSYGKVDAPFVHGQRLRLNGLALLLSMGAPCLLFSTVFGVLSLEPHYQYPELTYAIAGMGLLVLLVCGVAACSKSQWIKGRDEWQPNWLMFIFISMCIAWPFAVMLGETNFVENMEPYMNAVHLNAYHDIDPVVMQGAQLMDAATIQFTGNARVDTGKAMSFKSGSKRYCVAPISGNASAPKIYDFWAVGVNCCDGVGTQANFHCGAYRNIQARGGLRWLDDGDRPFFRLAVQQAEAAYNITAAHPLFFDSCLREPDLIVKSWRSEAVQMVVFGAIGHFIFQAFFVTVAAIVFSKLAAPLT